MVSQRDVLTTQIDQLKELLAFAQSCGDAFGPVETEWFHLMLRGHNKNAVPPHPLLREDPRTIEPETVQKALQRVRNDLEDLDRGDAELRAPPTYDLSDDSDESDGDITSAYRGQNSNNDDTERTDGSSENGTAGLTPPPGQRSLSEYVDGE